MSHSQIAVRESIKVTITGGAHYTERLFPKFSALHYALRCYNLNFIRQIPIGAMGNSIYS